jgi:hypothetical protein
MDWSRALPRPIALKDGGNIATLAAALSFMLSLPGINQRKAVWHDVGELLAEAAIDGTWISEFEMQLSQALSAEGLIQPSKLGLVAGE